jgi:hypothetical protein
MFNLTHISEGLRMFRRSLRVKSKGIKRYKGNAEQICKKIVKDCWNGRYFQVSNGNFPEFYMRDFGWCIDSLIKLGYTREVRKTLEHVLAAYSKNKKITTTITPKGKCIDVFAYSPDSLAFLIRSINAAGAGYLFEKYRDFLNSEIKRFYETVIDKKTGLAKNDVSFSSIKDNAKRKSSMYNNIMAAMLSDELKKTGLDNPLRKYNFREIIKNNFWTGSYFLDDLSGKRYVSGDANIFPFWSGVFNSKDMLSSCIAKMQEAGLDKPFPLRYTNKKIGHNMISIDLFASNYEGDVIWTHLGPLFIQLVRRTDRKKAAGYLKLYKCLIQRYMNFLEVFNTDGTPYGSSFYYADEGMLWAANYLTLTK